MKNLSGVRLLGAVALPLVATTLGVYITTFDLLDKVSTGVNAIDRARNEQVVQSAFGAAETQLANLTTDNAYWDDAARKVYEPTIDKTWVNDTWGYSTADGINYTMMALVEEDAALSLNAYLNGVAKQIVVADYFNGQITSLIRTLNSGDPERKSIATMINTADGLSIVALAPVRPSSEELEIAMPKTRYLVMARLLTPTVLGLLSKQYVIDGLALEPASSNSPGVAMLDPIGKRQAQAVWTDKRPGDEARNSVLAKTYAALGLLAFVMAALGGVCVRLFKTLALRERKTRHAAFHDTLTDLKNRAGLMLELNKHLDSHGQKISLAYADIDGFKNVNDTYDHNVGDQLMQYIANGMRFLTGETSVLSRVGGDEFVAAFTGETAAADARTYAANLIEFLKDPIELDGRFALVGASVGVCDGDGSDVTATELLRRADVAMYEAKTQGKNRFCTYAPEIDVERTTTQQIANTLRDIIAADSIGLAFQPIVDAHSRKVTGVEVLARWPETAPGKFTPDKFIAVAETTGLIDGLGESILRKACVAARNWKHIQLSINISPVQLRNPAFVQRSLDIISGSGIDPRTVEFEVTEGVLVEDLASVREMLTALRAAGVQIALDDFGAGYSSVGYLQKLTFDRIKIDRAITNGIELGRLEQGIAQGTVIMAKGMTARVTAEGVETEAQAKLLHLSGCSEFQGYYFHKPLSCELLGDLLRRQERGDAVAEDLLLRGVA
jgi:diguanylate cyclase (GGDEF)-like protein